MEQLVLLALVMVEHVLLVAVKLGEQAEQAERAVVALQVVLEDLVLLVNKIMELAVLLDLEEMVVAVPVVAQVVMNVLPIMQV
jgi:hypothetical protein